MDDVDNVLRQVFFRLALVSVFLVVCSEWDSCKTVCVCVVLLFMGAPSISLPHTEPGLPRTTFSVDHSGMYSGPEEDSPQGEIGIILNVFIFLLNI